MVLAAALLPFGAAAPSALAHTPPTWSLCVDKATLYDAPKGFAIAHLRKPQKLSVLADAEQHRWVLVRTKLGLSGWMPKGALCAPRKP